jgi:RND family efflux transporter MFP subunit
MRVRPLLLAFPCFGLVVTGALTGCGRRAGEGGSSQPPLVKVSAPVLRPVTDYEDFTGRTDAVDSVEVRARVSGYLDAILFEPGAEVKKGQPLFKIDPRPYKAALDQALGQVALYEARIERLNRDYQRQQGLVGRGAVSREDFEKTMGDRGEAQGALVAAKASVESNKLNLQFTDILSPIDGRVGRNLITLGNLVTQDQTLLTTVVSQDPMYAYFDVDERRMLHYQELIREGKVKTARTSKDIPVLMGLANEKGHPHKGTVDFVNNQVDTSTGTIQVRGTFPNPAGPNGERVLTPGLFVRIRIPIGDPHQAVLVSERAIGTDQGLKFVFVVDDQNVVERRPVTLGALHGGLREVEKGLGPKEWVVVAGLQRLVPGAEVRAERVDMPEPPPAPGPRPAPGEGKGKRP